VTALRLRSDSIRACLEKAREDKKRLSDRSTLICDDFRLFCAHHGITLAREQPTRILSYTRKARALLIGMWAGAILATCVFAALNYVSLEGPSVEITVGSLLFALLIGMVAQCTVAHIAGINILEKETTRCAERLLIVGGLSAISSLAVFCFLRFAANPNIGLALPFMSMIFELGTMLFVAAACELKPVYDWSEKFQRSFDLIQAEIQVLDLKISACLRQLGGELYGKPQNSAIDSGTQPDADSDPTAKPRKPNGSGGDHAGLR
jgi:hypothetical protein